VIEDMRFGFHTFKLWTLLQAMAFHSPFRDLQPGELRTTFNELRECLRDKNGITYSQHTLKKCLNELVAERYITILEAQSGRGMKIRIERWGEMQGKHDEGYEFSRYDYPPAANDGLHG
jgi:hypothetical protein